MWRKRDRRKKKRQGREGGRSDRFGGRSSCGIERRSDEEREGQREEEREAQLLGLFAVIGGALTR